MITNYNDTPMTHLTESDYDTLLVHLSEQLASLLRHFPEGEAIKAASDALTNEWRDDLTARQWLAVAGGRLGVDTSECVGV